MIGKLLLRLLRLLFQLLLVALTGEWMKLDGGKGASGPVQPSGPKAARKRRAREPERQPEPVAPLLEGGARRSVAVSTKDRQKGGSARRSLAEALRDPQTVRAAIVLGTALAPRASRRR